MDPHHLAALGEASSDIQASRLQFLHDIHTLYDTVADGRELTQGMRVEARRNQVRAVRRAVEAVDKLFVHAGGGSLRLDQPFQRFWRDLHAGMNHINNAAGPVYEGYSRWAFGLPIPATLRY
jgi:alkylation response protein AidB-like acyl-CoA dehydrogenase